MMINMEEAVIAHKKPFIFSSAWFMFIMLAAYLYIVLSLGPKLMKNRKPYQCKKFIVVYNIMQVLACMYLVSEILDASNYQVVKFWKCQVVEVSQEGLERYFKLAYFLYFLKLSEFSETLIFVLRKKYNQVSALHVFHHCSTVTLVYLLINYNINGFSAYYPSLLNSIVHVIMYSYYLLAAVADSNTLRRLLPVKKSITVIQMVQFTMILIQAFFIKKNCRIANIIVAYYIVVVSVIFYGFYDFYKKSYAKDNTHKNKSTILKKAAVL